ncbi:MAG TPA: RES domain-containing protein [Longimicrobiaceae bacterium]|nr:RES domain-containing protein [Longimicrobiaceae bacterium]
MIAWRICKQRHPVFDGTGAALVGARWNSAGRPVIYAAECLAGSLLEIIAHALRPRTLPGPHHGVRIDIPDGLAVETLEPAALPGWELPGSPTAREFGDRWFDEQRTPVLLVPAVTSRPVGRNVLINPLHPSANQLTVSSAFAVPWDERLF